MWRRGSPRQGVRSSARLFATYAVASLVPVAVLGGLMFRGLQDEAARQGRDQGRAQAAVITEMAIAPALHSADLSDGLTAGQRDRLQSATDLAIYRGSVLRLRLRTFGGRVVFSDDGETSGGVPLAGPEFRSAAAGQTVVSLVRAPDAPGGQIIRVLQPVVSDASGQALGVLELYLPYDAIDARLHEMLSKAYWQIGGSVGVLYLVLALISWSTTRSLRRYALRQQHEALHDGLTGLPNREAFRERAAAAVTTGAGALVIIDLNRFKEVNDTLGHHAGDELLRAVGDRLRPGLRAGDTLARLGGDEFALILPDLAADEVRALLDRLRHDLTREIVLDGVPLSIEASFGVALYPSHGTDVDELLRRADAAMYQGKRGATDIVVYTGERTAHPTQWLVVLAELRHALDRDELVLHYQPKVRLSDGRISGVEALVRWQHPTRGLLPPSEFLPAAEQSGLIEPLTAWVLRRALADQAGWNAAGHDWSVSVNVSARNLETPGFVAFVASALEQHGSCADRLLLEITETALAGDADSAAHAVRELAELGVQISIDDFGTGFTSLSQLPGLPIAEIKVDRGFVAGVLDSPQSRAVIRSVLTLAHGLGSRVTAEGVEDPLVAHWLAQVGCDEAQGYLYSRPVVWTEIRQPVYGGVVR